MHQLTLVVTAALAAGSTAALMPLEPSAPQEASAPQERIASKAPAHFTAVAISTGGPRTDAATARVDITIDRWSTDAERQRLLDALKQGQDSLLETLRDLKPVGRIHTPGNIGYDLHYANQVPGDEGGRRIFVATDRPISYWEAAHRPRTFDYPFTFIEMRMTREGVGEGRLTLATRVTASRDGRYVELEHYAAQPVQLTEIRRVERSE